MDYSQLGVFDLLAQKNRAASWGPTTQNFQNAGQNLEFANDSAH